MTVGRWPVFCFANPENVDKLAALFILLKYDKIAVAEYSYQKREHSKYPGGGA